VRDCVREPLTKERLVKLEAGRAYNFCARYFFIEFDLGAYILRLVSEPKPKGRLSTASM
jgi:hypothetical protein